jgi:hypothetical protein
MVNLPDDHPEKQREFFHRQMNEEACVMENAARSLAEFTDADWRVRKGLARQCADEARHVPLQRALEARGGRVGQYPVMNFQYRILGRIDSLVGRLAIQNRSFEADGLDAATYARDEARQAGDHELADMYDAQQADGCAISGSATSTSGTDDPGTRTGMVMARRWRRPWAFAQILPAVDGSREVRRGGRG